MNFQINLFNQIYLKWPEAVSILEIALFNHARDSNQPFANNSKSIFNLVSKNFSIFT